MSKDDWLNMLRLTFQPTTIEGYGWEVETLKRWCDRVLEDLSTSDLTRYLAERRAQGCGDSSIKRSIAALKSFYAFTLGDRSPAQSLPWPTVHKHAQRTLNWQQAFAVLTSCDTSCVRGKRDLAVLTLLLDTGLRESEVCRLRVDAVDMEARHLNVVVKGGDEEGGAFSADTAQFLLSWLSVRSACARSDVRTLFVNTTRGLPLTSSGLRVIFRRIRTETNKSMAGDPMWVPMLGFSPHDLRRSFATLTHRRGAPSRITQVAGRWKDYRQLETYTQALTAEDIDPYSPVAWLVNPNRTPGS